jgi:hypothetical protein
MRNRRAFSFLLRAGAISAFLAGLVCHTPPLRSAAFQASTAFPQVPNLVGYWPLDSANAGVTPDLSGTSPANNGTLLGGSATIDTVNKAPVPSGNPASLAVSASGDIVDVPDSASLSVTGSLTLAAWIRPTVAPDPTTGHQHGIIEKWVYTSAAINGYYMRLDRVNCLNFTICGASGILGQIETTPRAISTNLWTHLACTYDSVSGAMTMYNNGTADFTTGSSSGPPTAGASDLHIGDGMGAQQYGGNIDEARIYTKALTVDEVAILMSMNQPPASGFTASANGSQVNLSWTAASNAGTVPVVYTILRGTTSGVYTTAINNISGSTYTDTPPASGTYYYTIAAVSVIPSAYATEQSAVTNGTPPPPPPPPGPKAPRTGGKDNKPCGCGIAHAPGAGGLLAVAAAAALLLILRRR